MKPESLASKRHSLVDRIFAYFDAQRPSDRLLLAVLLVVAVTSATLGAIGVSVAASQKIPTSGGTLVEGIVGTPRFVHPVLALTRTDRDLTALLYSGLLRVDTSGALVPELAESVTVSDDGRVYNVVLRRDAQFHDGTPITADDVAFTVSLIQDPALKSPRRGDWNGVTVEVLGEHELNFVLSDPYTPFRENLTLGIMPQHIWNTLSAEAFPFSERNTNPVGSGPYRLSGYNRDNSGLITSYTLTAHEDGRPAPKIKTVRVKFYPNQRQLQEAFLAGDITSTASLGYADVAKLSEREPALTVVDTPLPRLFAVFFNQNRSVVLRDEAARNALAAAIDRDALIAATVNGFGTATTLPVPPQFAAFASSSPTTATSSPHEILEAGGWERNAGVWQKEIDDEVRTLRIDLATSNSPRLSAIARELATMWEKLGVAVNVDLYEESDLTQTVIRPREYETLLFGMNIGRALDLYPFWHSSQREDPGLNVALYTNLTVDDALETARTTQEQSERAAALGTFVSELQSETPAAFLFSPHFVYAYHDTLTIAPLAPLGAAEERFANIRQWHIEEESVWPIFTNR